MVTQVRRDALPEGLRTHSRRRCGHVQDCGCEVAPCCLECPLPICRYDAPNGIVTAVNYERDEAIREMARDGADSSEIAGALGVSRRTVFRVLKAARRE